MSTIDWKSDWLYKLILIKADGYWKWCKPDDKSCQYVLVEETSTVYRGIPVGDTIRSWIRDANGLREISAKEYAKHIEKIDDRFFPFIRMTFYIFPDREHVSIGESSSGSYGAGRKYIVRRHNDTAQLEPGPDDTRWSWIV